MNIVKVPGVNGLGHTSGCEKAPDKICKSLGLVADEIKLDNENIEEQQKRILSESKKYMEKNPIFIGGDHSISYPLCYNFFKKNKRGKLIVFDAHADCMPAMREPTHEEWVNALVESKAIEGKDVLLIGARKIEHEELNFMEKNGIRNVRVEDLRENIDEVKREINDFMGKDKVYVSFDIDVFDSSIVKATGYPEKDGFNEKEVYDLLNCVFSGNVISLDLVEYNPTLKGANETERVVKEVLRRFINRLSGEKL